jgi:hypothetical protein
MLTFFLFKKVYLLCGRVEAGSGAGTAGAGAASKFLPGARAGARAA